jgi:hypothetical protein
MIILPLVLVDLGLWLTLGMVMSHEKFESLGQVAQHMPSVSYLDGLWSPCSSGISQSRSPDHDC